jgi:hypothetical protein
MIPHKIGEHLDLFGSKSVGENRGIKVPTIRNQIVRDFRLLSCSSSHHFRMLKRTEQGKDT